MRIVFKLLGVLIIYYLIGLIGGGIFTPVAEFVRWSTFVRIAVGGILLLFGGIAVGVLVKEYWYLSGICAWYAFLSSLFLYAGFPSGDIMSPYFIFAVYTILPIALSLLGGYIGFQIRNRLSEIRIRKL